jgi:transposase
MKSPQDEIEQLKQEIAELRQLLNEALATIKELQAQLDQNSRNSNWPSSREKGSKKRRTKSLRQKSDKAAGGQAGHAGQTLELSASVDRIVRHRPEQCAHCQATLPPSGDGQVSHRRQVVDIPPLLAEIVEHQVESVVCACCGCQTTGDFPAGVSHPVQYGPRLKALVVYLKDEHFIPYDRSRRFLHDLFGVALSPGTLQNTLQQAAQRLQPVTEKIKAGLGDEPVVHFDESGFHIGGQRQWLHSAGSSCLTYYAPHAYRGQRATEEIGILPHFRGTAHHDHWATYWQYEQCRHALCNVHHLRELNALIEQGDQPWAARFKHFLLAVKAVVEAVRQRGHTALPPDKLAQIERLYHRLTTLALQANPPPLDGWPQGKRGPPKKSKARNFAERLAKHYLAVLAFAYDFKVPFDNNLAERDLRMLKVQQKISGCFRSLEGAQAFCTVRTYISSLRKQGISIWAALNSIFSGQLIEPAYTTPV